MFLPLLVASILAHATTVLLLKRSILTEKVARRGFHLSREYATDPLEILFVREVMRTKLVALPAEATVDDLTGHPDNGNRATRAASLYPVVDNERRVQGVMSRKKLREAIALPATAVSLGDMLRKPIVAHPDEPLRAVVLRMAETGFTRLPVDGAGQSGIIGNDLAA